jgi:hypothetical protein
MKTIIAALACLLIPPPIAGVKVRIKFDGLEFSSSSRFTVSFVVMLLS